MSKKVTINVDHALEAYNEKNPDAPLNKEGLLNLLDEKVSQRTFSNWKLGKVPSAFKSVFEICEICGVEVDDIITIENL